MHPLTPEQATAFLHALAGDRLEALFIVAIHTGLRQGELLALKWQDVDLEARRLMVRTSLQRAVGHKRIKQPKTDDSRRRLPLTAIATEALRAHRTRQLEERLAARTWEEHDLMFPSHTGKPGNHTTLRERHFKPALRRAGLPDIPFHDLRHTCASLLNYQGVNMKEISQMLGHSSISTTMDVYTHLLPAGERAAAALDRLLG